MFLIAGNGFEFIAVSILVLMDSRIKIFQMRIIPEEAYLVSILVLMDSRIKIRLETLIEFPLCHVSILVLMDSRIKIKLHYNHLLVV